LTAGLGQTLSTTFTPDDIENYTTAIDSVSINITQITPTITWSNPADITYGTPLSSTQLDATSSVPGSFVYTPPSGTVLAAGLGQTLSTTFTPTDIENYTTAIDSVSINVTQVTSTITWSNPADITYGTPLSSTQLDATYSVPGSFVYTPATGTVLAAGLGQTLSTTFTPTDIENYTTATDSVSINVTQVTPTITWSNPADITYGTPLSSTQLDATSSDPVSGVIVSGTFVYTPPSGTILGTGSDQALNTNFTPTDTTNYTTTSASVSINVTQATPTITWSNPANITYGTPLSSTQLDANASNPVSGDTVPGNFVYTPPSGTVFESVGTQTLSTTFTPTDTANYTTASASVLINVTQATPIITWSNPANITYGTPLSSTQLDATTVIPGYFVYIQPQGTILNTGQQMLNTLFIPTDLVDYYITSATVFINVTQPAPPALAYITNYGSNNVSVIDTAKNNVVANVTGISDPEGVAISPDGTKVYVVQAYTNTISVINTTTNTVSYTLQSGTAYLGSNGAAISPNGLNLYVTTYPGVVNVINTINNTSYAQIILGTGTGGSPNGIAFAPDGKKVYVAGSPSGNSPGYVYAIDTNVNNATYNTIIATVEVDPSPGGLAVTPDGKKVYVASYSGDNNPGVVDVINTTTNTVTTVTVDKTWPFGVAVTPDGSTVYVTNTNYGSGSTVSVINTSKDIVIGNPIPVGDWAYGIAVTPDGKKAYVVNSLEQPGTVSVIDTNVNNVATYNTVIATVPVGTEPSVFGQFIGTPPL
jgi:YVTN family beta-propeller protein